LVLFNFSFFKVEIGMVLFSGKRSRDMFSVLRKYFLGVLFIMMCSPNIAYSAEKMIAITDDASAGVDVVETSQNDDVIKMLPDRPMVLKLDGDVANILIGNDLFLNIFPDSRRTLILMPLVPGATFFKALDEDGNTIIEKRVIIASPENEYIRVRQACGSDDELCTFQSIYYCPDMCHSVYDYSNNERINQNEKIRNKDDEDKDNSDDTPSDLTDASESEPQ
jgi:hypothetical protein